jgi:hypothetical protein
MEEVAPMEMTISLKPPLGSPFPWGVLPTSEGKVMGVRKQMEYRKMRA